MTEELAGDVAIVTGSSRGIGAATARTLADRGASVVVNYCTSPDAAEAVVDEIGAAGGEAIAVRADVTDADAVEAMVERTHEAFGAVDILVNNANMPFEHAPIDELSWADFEAKLTAELGAAVRCTKAVVPDMVGGGGGRIVYVSSGLSRSPTEGFAAHGTAKAALNTFATYVAEEYGPDGIRANVVAPGLVETDATADRVDAVREHVGAETPLGRVAQPPDVARTIAAFAGSAADFATGTYTPVNGGNGME